MKKLEIIQDISTLSLRRLCDDG